MDHSNYAAVLFDLDGTLLDTLRDLHNALQYALSQNGFASRTIEETKAFVGDGVSRLILRGMGDHAPENAAESPIFARVFADFRQYYATHCQEYTRPYDGILPMLSLLRENGLKLAVLSNKPEERVCALCEHFFPGHFTICAGERHDLPRKPSPEGIHMLLRRMNCAREQAVYVGDSEVDVKTAKNAGIDGIFVTWGFRSEDELRLAGAKRLVSSPRELPAMLGIPFEEMDSRK